MTFLPRTIPRARLISALTTIPHHRLSQSPLHRLTFSPSSSNSIINSNFNSSLGNIASRRTMSDKPAITAPPPGKYEFLIVVPDKPGMLAKRLEVRPQHFAGLKALTDSGAFKMGGATLNETTDDPDATKWDFHGSTVVMVAASKEECLETLRKDIYAKSGVWDVDNAYVWPFKPAFRIP